MKILKLDLLAYGPFTNCELPFPTGKSGLHVVFGLNEAGKSSALRGLRHALYGIPERTTDDFLHTSTNLRLGLSLERSSGDQLSFIRRKGRVRTLLDLDGSTPLDDAALQPFLSGVSQQTFEAMFGLDHAALIRGGREIVHFEGDVGKVLFGAAAGIADLKNVQSQLKKDADEFFTAGGKKPRINAAISALEQSKKTLRDAHIPSKKFADLAAQRDELRQSQQQYAGELQQLSREQTRLERIKTAIPQQGKLRELRRQIEALAGVQVVPEDFPTRRTEAITALAAATDDLKSATERRQQLTEELQNITVPQELLDHGAVLEDLPKQLGSHAKAQQDLPSLCDQRDSSLRVARNLLAELRPDLTLDKTDTLKLTKAQRVAIENLGLRHAALNAEVKQADQELQIQTRELAQCQAQLPKLAEVRDAAGLRAALSRVAGEGPLESELAAANQQLRASTQQTAIDLSKLTLWSGSLDDLEKLSVPSLESIDAHDDALKNATDEIKRLEKVLAQNEADVVANRQELERLRLAEGQVPSEEELARARTLRDEGWQLVKRSWLEKKKDSGEAAAFASQVQFGADLPTAYEVAVRHADEMVDRLRRESDRVARRAHLEVEQNTRTAALEKTTATLGTAQTLLGSAQQNWLGLWQPLGITPGTPKEMRAWIKQQEALVRQAQELRGQQLAIDKLLARIESAKKDLSRALTEIGDASPDELETLVALQQRAENRAKQIEEAHRNRADLEKEIDRRTAELESERSRLQTAKDELASWQQQWRTALAPLGLPGDALPSQANEVLQQIADLLAEVSNAKSLDERISSMTREAKSFETRVAELAAEVKVAKGNTSVEQLAKQLVDLWRQAGRNQAQRTAFEDELAQVNKTFQSAQKIIVRRQSELKAMCQEAGCSDPGELPAIERDSARLRQLREQSRPLEESLAGLAGSLSLEAFEAELAACDADELPAKIDHAKAASTAAQEKLQAINIELGAVEQSLRDMDGAADASAAAIEVQDLLARIGEDSLEYARLRLAAHVLQAAIDRYREKNQGPLIDSAGRHFAELTCGRYSGLQVEFDQDTGQARLVGVRAADQKAVPVEAMSEGTADQLYLALRLASLEVYSQHQEPMPLIVDDVLIQFDNQRAAATLRALASVARQNQVIVFTHHEHLLDLAASTLKTDEFSVQHLAS